jgi:hypothetical protein
VLRLGTATAAYKIACLLHILTRNKIKHLKFIDLNNAYLRIPHPGYEE